MSVMHCGDCHGVKLAAGAHDALYVAVTPKKLIRNFPRGGLDQAYRLLDRQSQLIGMNEGYGERSGGLPAAHHRCRYVSHPRHETTDSYFMSAMPNRVTSVLKSR